MTTTSEHLWKKLAGSKTYREEFVAAQVKRAVPFQISALMGQKGLTQKELAKRAGLTQGVISRAADPGYGNLTLNTIIRVAAGLDVAFIGKFVPFSELVTFFDDLSEEDLANVPSFDEERDPFWAQDVARIAAGASAGVTMGSDDSIPEQVRAGAALSGTTGRALRDKLNELPHPRAVKAGLRPPDQPLGLAVTPKASESRLGDERIAVGY